ncbi:MULTISPECIES: oxidoreductase [unclassified Iodidimonas]|jgi:scyllo-inositol 2-dehydrogenase (NADP+)|uniref:oxidoreductase n=1 Tax=unclassified Iodidimonas TaxID=2626145 RepID=UPI002482429E|nr:MULTISPECIES: oxidoreductase [unclassified Iodidimonas]
MDRIKVGLLGYGLAGSVFHAPLIGLEPRMHLAAIHSSRVEQIAHDCPGAAVIGSADDLIGRDDLDLIVVATPNDSHFTYAQKALEAGKHVVVDKPLALDAGQADALIALAQKEKRHLSVFQNRRWDSGFLSLQSAMAQGRLGAVSFVELHFDRFRPQIKQGWREVPAPGAGVLYDLGAHLIDQALFLFGKPDAITADCQQQRAGARVCDYFHLVLFYGTCRVVLHVTTLAPKPGPTIMAHGDGGSFFAYGLDPQEAWLKAGRRPDDHQAGALWGGDLPLVDVALFNAEGGAIGLLPGDQRAVPGHYGAFYGGMAKAILDGADVPVDPLNARQGLSILAAAEESSKTGCRMACD